MIDEKLSEIFKVKGEAQFRKYTEHMIMTVFLIRIALSMLISNVSLIAI